MNVRRSQMSEVFHVVRTTAPGVPLVPNPPLARALYRLELDSEVPSEHYKAVAEIIAFVWRLRGRAA